MILEDVKFCIVCGASERRKVGAGYDYMYETSITEFSVNECANCHHIFLSPRPAVEAADIIYPQTYSSFVGQTARHQKSAVALIKDWVVVRRFKKPLKDRDPGSLRILEIGAGDCSLLMSVKRHFPGAICTALDIKFSELTKETAIANGISCLTGTAEEVLPGYINQFDIIIMNQLVEHLWNPVGVIGACYAALSSNGVLLIETPDPEGYDRQFFKEGAWGNYYFPRHLNLFSRDGLVHILNGAGFQKVENYSLCAPLCWVFTMNSLRKISKKWIPRWIANVKNPLPLLIFTPIDLAAILLGKRTSNQKFVARK